MSAPAMLRVFALGRRWTVDDMDATARGWRAELVDRLGERESLVATAPPADGAPLDSEEDATYSPSGTVTPLSGPGEARKERQ
jgi:hypothetical protein